MGWIVDLALIGDRIVALDAMLDPSVHVFDPEEPATHVASYGRRGDGPGEFKDPEQIVIGASKLARRSMDSGWRPSALDAAVARTSWKQARWLPRRPFRIDGPNAGSLVRVPDGRWFAGGWITDGRVARFRADRSYDRTIVGFPPDAEAPGMTLLQAYESRVVADPAGDRLAAATLLAGLLEIFDYDGAAINRSGSRTQPLSARVGTGAIPRRARRDVGRSRDALRVHGSGGDAALPVRPLLRWQSACRKVLHGRRRTYRSSGGTAEYVKTLQLDRTAEAITVDATDTWLYASGPEPTPWVGRFRLPEPSHE